LTYKSLLTQVWGPEHANKTDYLKVHVHNLRKKIEKDPENPHYIVTERGLGYRFHMTYPSKWLKGVDTPGLHPADRQ
jgi:DNA-binding response OmpR family regulator